MPSLSNAASITLGSCSNCVMVAAYSSQSSETFLLVELPDLRGEESHLKSQQLDRTKKEARGYP